MKFVAVLLLLVVIIVVVTTQLTQRPALPNSQSAIKANQLTVYAIAAAAWPLVLIYFCYAEWKNGSVFDRPVMWIASLWVMLVFAVDIYMLQRTPYQTVEGIERKKAEYLTTTNVVLGAVFTFGVLLSHMHNKRSLRAANITVTSLFMAILFVLPIFDIDTSDPLAYTLAAIVKVACVYSVGIFVFAIALELSGSAFDKGGSISQQAPDAD